jgi:5-methylcytosine-specific restriction endonuclease McrBC GTP-binding regulatory subunit McrB
MDGTTPGNYCMIEVKPNWHDSTELLGYYSRLGNNPSYQFTKFVKFLVKAKMYPNVPFFVCLDEMNLAPVEQYFAEILSILETRKHPKNKETGEVDMTVVKTEPIINAPYFRELSEMPHIMNVHTGELFNSNLTDRDIYLKLFEINTNEAIEKEQITEEVGNRYDLTTEGLILPDNVVIIGTVNMDDTTHQFSRKVIDRAMTIEMNGGNLRNMFGGSKKLEYLPEEEQKKWQYAFNRLYVTADEVLEVHSDVAEELTDKLPSKLEQINLALKGTPFEVSYRVLNELTIMVGVMLDQGKELDDAIAQSVNNILLMKILPRIEGDAERFAL